jgi:phosphatidylglycerophosphatase A
MRTDKRWRSTKEDSITLASPPSIRFLLAHPAHLVACGFGSGLSPRAPGTVGTLFAWASFPLLRPWMSDLEILGFTLPLFRRRGSGSAQDRRRPRGHRPWQHRLGRNRPLLGWSCCSARRRAYGKPQPSACSAFFDIVKPQPARYFDEKVKNGFGVMCDDLVAAGYTLLVLAILRFVLE